MTPPDRPSPLVLALILVATGGTAFAQSPAKAPAAAPLASGQAAGTLTAKGRTVKLACAAVFVDQTDEAKPVILVLTEQPVPSASWKSHSDLMSHHRNKSPIVGLVFRLDAQREVDTAEYFVEAFPTSTSGIFQLTFEGAPGRAYVGTAKSTATAAKLREPVALDARFNAVLN